MMAPRRLKVFGFRPSEALQRNSNDDFGMMTVTIKQLETLNAHQSLTQFVNNGQQPNRLPVLRAVSAGRATKKQLATP